MINCPICDANSEMKRHFASRKNEKLDLRKCLKCQHEFLSPFPSDEWLGEEYSHYFVKRQSGLTRAKKNYFKLLFSELGYNFNKKSILEFGPGEGDAISAVQEMSSPLEITVVERNEEATNHLKDLKCNHYNMFLEEYISSKSDSRKYDFVFLFDVLEHLKDPLHVLELIKAQKLNDGGMIIASFPVVDSVSRKIMGNLWPQYKVEHLNYFTDASIVEMADKTKLKLKKNEVLFKKLSIDYLLNVGKGFGPLTFKNISSKVESVTPSKIKKMNLNLGYGEKLVVFQN